MISNGGLMKKRLEEQMPGSEIEFSDITIGSGQSRIVSGGEELSNANVNYKGTLTILNGGSANLTNVNSGGTMYISSGGTATEVIENGGFVSVYEGANVTFRPNTISGLKLVRDMTLHSGTTATDTTINYDGDVYVSSGGLINNTTINSGGELCVDSSGLAENVTVNIGGELLIFNGGSALEVMENGGMVLGGAEHVTFVPNVLSGLDLKNYGASLHSGTTATMTVVGSGAELHVFSSGSAGATTVNESGTLYASHGGFVVSTTVNAGGIMYVVPKAEVEDETESRTVIISVDQTVVNSGGSMLIYPGAGAENTVLNAGARMTIASAGVHAGTLTIENGAAVTVEEGGRIDFTLSGRTASADYLINDLSLISGTPDYSVTVAADQTSGTYKLAQGAAAFDQTITLIVDNESAGTLTIGETLNTGSGDFTLNLNNGNLTLTISGTTPGIPDTPDVPDVPDVPDTPDVPVPDNGDTVAAGKMNGIGGAIIIDKEGKGTLKTAAGSVEISGTIDMDRWKLLGAGSFRSGAEGSLIWEEKSSGDVYIQNDLSSFEDVNHKSTLLGTLADGYEIFGVGDFAGTGTDGVVMTTPAFGDAEISTNYGLAVWGTDSEGNRFDGWLGALVNTWEPGTALKGDLADLDDVNANNYRYEVVCTGDFNGDGRTDVMLQNVMPETVDGVAITGAGDVFTFLSGELDAVKAGEDPTVIYAGKATGGWEIAGSGDFDGDGIDDVLLRNGTDVAGWSMFYGYRAGDQLFGELSLNEEIAGIADYDDDGTDDILIRNCGSGEMTAWLVKDGTVTGTAAML